VHATTVKRSFPITIKGVALCFLFRNFRFCCEAWSDIRSFHDLGRSPLACIFFVSLPNMRNDQRISGNGWEKTIYAGIKEQVTNLSHH
jgi:hypothetical protein